MPGDREVDVIAALRGETQAGFNRLSDEIRHSRAEATQAHTRLREDFTEMLVEFTGRVVLLEASATEIKRTLKEQADEKLVSDRERRQLLLKVMGLAVSVSGVVTWIIDHFRFSR